MAKNKKEEELTEELQDRESERQRLREERKQLKAEQKAQKKEAKQKAREISDQEEELDGEPGGLPVFLVTAFIVAVWIAILCVLIKLDVGGVGSNILKPILKDIPVVNKILPGEKRTDEEEDEYSIYADVEDAVAQIKQLEQELQIAQEQNLSYANEISELKEENNRLRNFEEDQLKFEQMKNEFYEEVVYAENGPGVEEYQKYYEAMDPAAAEYLYQMTIQETAADKELSDYVATFSAMKAKEAAAMFDTMTSDLDLVAKILKAMSADDRAKIMGQMNAEDAASLSKMMD
nr:hypothetical protein [Lachnospiraceae bacterium]